MKLKLEVLDFLFNTTKVINFGFLYYTKWKGQNWRTRINVGPWGRLYTVMHVNEVVKGNVEKAAHGATDDETKVSKKRVTGFITVPLFTLLSSVSLFGLNFERTSFKKITFKRIIFVWFEYIKSKFKRMIFFLDKIN